MDGDSKEADLTGRTGTIGDRLDETVHYKRDLLFQNTTHVSSSFHSESNDIRTPTSSASVAPLQAAVSPVGGDTSEHLSAPSHGQSGQQGESSFTADCESTRGGQECESTGACLSPEADGAGDDKDKWILDSGATMHIANDHAWFKADTFSPSEDYTIDTAGGVMKVDAMGNVLLILKPEGQAPVELELTSVVYSPSATVNILSLSRLIETNDLRGMYWAGGITMEKPDGSHIGTATLRDGLFYVDVFPKVDESEGDSKTEGSSVAGHGRGVDKSEDDSKTEGSSVAGYGRGVVGGTTD